MRHRLLTTLLCLLPALVAWGQFDVHFGNYWQLKGYYNPSYSGAGDRINIAGTYSMQLLGFDGAPQSMWFGADLPFKLFGKMHGAGAGFFNESIGKFKNQIFYAQYSYRQPIRRGVLSGGFRLGAVTVSFDPTDLVFVDEDMDDPAFPTSETDGMSFDLGVGLAYEHPWFWTAVSAAHLTGPTVKMGDNGEYKVKPSLNFMAGGNIKTGNPFISIQPSFMMQTDFMYYRYDITARMAYEKGTRSFYGGAGYSPGTSVSFMFGARIKDFVLGYAYEMFTSAIGAASGNHDIVLGYSFEMNFKKKTKNKHKSIRIL